MLVRRAPGFSLPGVLTAMHPVILERSEGSRSVRGSEYGATCGTTSFAALQDDQTVALHGVPFTVY
jgi:hypothetical protein